MRKMMRKMMRMMRRMTRRLEFGCGLTGVSRRWFELSYGRAPMACYHFLWQSCRACVFPDAPDAPCTHFIWRGASDTTAQCGSEPLLFFATKVSTVYHRTDWLRYSGFEQSLQQKCSGAEKCICAASCQNACDWFQEMAPHAFDFHLNVCNVCNSGSSRITCIGRCMLIKFSCFVAHSFWEKRNTYIWVLGENKTRGNGVGIDPSVAGGAGVK